MFSIPFSKDGVAICCKVWCTYVLQSMVQLCVVKVRYFEMVYNVTAIKKYPIRSSVMPYVNCNDKLQNNCACLQFQRRLRPVRASFARLLFVLYHVFSNDLTHVENSKNTPMIRSSPTCCLKNVHFYPPLKMNKTNFASLS